MQGRFNLLPTEHGETKENNTVMADLGGIPAGISDLLQVHGAGGSASMAAETIPRERVTIHARVRPQRLHALLLNLTSLIEKKANGKRIRL